MYKPMTTQEEFDVAKARSPQHVEFLLNAEKRRIAKSVSDQLRREGVRFWTLRFWSGVRMNELVAEAFDLFNRNIEVAPYVMAPALTVHGIPIAKSSNDSPKVAPHFEDNRVYFDPVTKEEFRADQIPVVTLFDKHKGARLRAI